MGQTLYTFNGGGTSGKWSDASTWTTDPTGSTDTNINKRVPAAGDNVVITNSFVVNLDKAVTAANLNVTIQRGGVLNLATYTMAGLNTLAGQGTLRLSSTAFPSVATNNFDDPNTGTVEYYNLPATAGPVVLPATMPTYNNLLVRNTSTTAFEVRLNQTLTVNGNLTLAQATNAAAVTFNIGNATNNPSWTLNVLGDVTVGAGTTLGIAPVAGVHTINVSGSFTNNGRVNLHNGTADDNQVALLNFQGGSDANFACNGPTDLHRLQVNKGTDSQVLLNVTSTQNTSGIGVGSQGNLRLNAVSNGRILILMNGVAKFGNNIYLARIHIGTVADNGVAGTGYYELGSSSSSPTLWLDGATIINNALATIIYGRLRVTNGTFDAVTPYSMVLREDAQVLIEKNGTVKVQKFRPSTNAVNPRGSFIITGGLLDCQGTNTTSAGEGFSRFSMPYITQSFRMTGGTIRVQNPEGTDGMFHIGVDPNNAIVTGGTIEVVLPATTTTAKILTTAPLWNLTVKRASTSGTSKAILSAMTNMSGTNYTLQPLTVLNNFTLDGTNATTTNKTIFDAASQQLTIQGTLALNANTTFLPGTNQTTIFSGGQNQLLTNNGTIADANNTFTNLVIDKSAGTLTLGGTNSTYTIATKLSLLNGVLNDGGKTINVLGDMVNTASHTSGGGSGRIALAGTGSQTVSGNDMGVFGNLSIGTRSSGTVAMTANMSVASRLTLNYVLDIGANRLALTSIDPNAIAIGTPSTTCMIRTAGNQSDLGVQKTYGGAGGSFTFPVGTGTGTAARYAPATINLTLVNAAGFRFGQVSVSPTSRANPFVTSTNVLPYYWKVRSVGFDPNQTKDITQTFRMTNADAVGTRSAYIPAYYLADNVAWTKINDVNQISDLGSVSDVTFAHIGNFDGEFTAGDPAAFNAVTAYYSRTSGAWATASTWAIGSPTGTTATSAPKANNPVFIGSATTTHTITVGANGATAGSLVIDRRSVLDVGATTGHNFGALPDSKVGGSGRLRITASGTTVTFPGGDFGSFIDMNGGTVEYYTSSSSFTLPTTATTGSGTTASTLALVSYRNLLLNSQSSTRAITLPAQNLRVYASLKTGVTYTAPDNTVTAYPGTVLTSASTTTANLRIDSLLAVQNGIFRLQGSTPRTLTLDTDAQVADGATFDVVTTATSALTHAMTVGGSLVNNGNLDFKVGNAQLALTFVGSQDARLTSASSGTGKVTDLYSLTVNKGLGRAALLTLDGAGSLTTPAAGWLTLTNGTLNYTKTANGTAANLLTIHDGTSLTTPYIITDNAGLTVNTPGGIVSVANTNNAAVDLKLAGQLQILQGTLRVGNTGNAGNDIEYASAGAPGINITGGNLYVNGQIRRTVANLDGSLRFDQGGGTIDIDGQGATAAQSNERGLFEVQGPGSFFRMSGGFLNLHRSNRYNMTSPPPILTADLYLATDSAVVRGGTVVLGNTTSIGNNVAISVSSNVPLYDLQVAPGTSGSTNTGLLTGVLPLTLKGSLSIGNDFSTFNANGRDLNIAQALVNNNSSASTALIVPGGGFVAGTTTQTTTFTGGITTQPLTGTAANLTAFGSLTLNTPQASGTLQLGGNALVAGTLTLAKGTLDDNGKTITVLGDVLNTATHTSGGPGTGSLVLGGSVNQNIGGNGAGRFGNVRLNNASGATTTANQEITSVLTLSSGILSIGSNLLLLSNPGAGTVVGADATHYIRTNGIVADLGLRKNYPSGALNFVFPVGVDAKYTPVTMNVKANSAPGYLTVQPIDLTHPSTTGKGTNRISFYWKVSSTLASPTVDQAFTYGPNDVAGDETLYKLGRFFNGAWTPQNGIAASAKSTTAANTVVNPGYQGTAGTIDGDYTSGDASEFGPVPTFYSRTSTAGQPNGAVWNNPAAWTTNADGSDPASSFAATPTLANPVVIAKGHTITSATPSLGAANLKLDGILDLGANGGNNFNTVTGTGTVRIGSALFPAGNYAVFMAAGGGSVDYTGPVQLPARDTYNNLTFSGGNSKQLSNLDLTINGTLEVKPGTTVDNSTSQNITLTSATSGATLGGTFNLNDGNLTTGAFLTNSGTLNLGAGLTSLGTSFSNTGTLNNGTGDVRVGTDFSNAGIYNNGSTGNLTVGGSFTNSNTYNAGKGLLTVGTLTNAATSTFNTSTGGIVVNGSLVNSGSYLQGGANLLRVAGDFTNTSTGTFSNNGSTLALNGNFANTGTFSNTQTASGDPADPSGLVQFITDANRVFSGNATLFDVQKIGAANLLLAPGTTLTVANVLTMRGGLLSTGVSGTVELTNTTTQPIVGASPTSYLNGRLSMLLPDAAASIRVFPVGLGGRYRPVTLTPQQAGSAAKVLVEIFNSPPAGKTDNTLSNLSANRYYRIQLLSGTINQPIVQLSFNTDVEDEKVTVPGNLRVARLDRSRNLWTTAGGAGVFSPDSPRGYTISAGTQTVVDGSSLFALASTSYDDNNLTGRAPLPVQLLSFAAARQGATVRTTWATASEHNSAYFVVQRSADGRTFADVQQVLAQGTSLLRHDYAAVDAQPLPGTSYYRLRQVDLDGTVAYSAVATVRFTTELGTPTLVAYPNPTAGQRFQVLTTGLAATGGTVQLHDNVGRLVLTQAAPAGAAEATIAPAQPLASGLYLLTWQTADGQQLTTKLVVE
jgi:fibronectin-binding autotransporter adhesin